MKRACVLLSITILIIACLAALCGFGSKTQSADYEKAYRILCSQYIRSNSHLNSVSQIYNPTYVHKWKRKVKMILVSSADLEPSRVQLPAHEAFTNLLLHQISFLDQIEGDALRGKRKAVTNHYFELYDTMVRDLRLTIQEAKRSRIESSSELNQVEFELNQFQV